MHHSRGIGLTIRGGQPIKGQPGISGAVVVNIREGIVATQLHGELAVGDEIVEWNGVCLRNKSDDMVREIVSQWAGEIELTVRLDKQPYKLPRHHNKRSDYDHYQSSENVTGGYESPLSDKSWTKEFDDSRHSSRLNSRSSISPREDFTKVNHNHHKELEDEELNRRLTDMSNELDNMNRQPSSDQEMPGFDHLSKKTLLSQHPPVLPREAEPNANTTENSRPQRPRGSSDVGLTPERVEPPRRMSHHAERLRHGHPASPRTGRPPNAMRLKDCGEIEAMLVYDYAKNLLVIRVERAIGLALPNKDTLNPFIKIHFLKHNKITEKRCTRYIDCTANPRWEQSFTFNVAEEELSAHKIKLSAWDYFQPKQNMFIGTAIIDLSSQQHVDGNMRTYKLDSDPGDRRDCTPHSHRTSRSDVRSPPRRAVHGDPQPRINQSDINTSRSNTNSSMGDTACTSPPHSIQSQRTDHSGSNGQYRTEERNNNHVKQARPEMRSRARSALK